MEWSMATLRLMRPDCPAAFGPGTLRCAQPGGAAGAFGYAQGAPPAGWEVAVRARDGSWVAGPPAACANCPLARLPRGVCATNVRAGPGGLNFDLLFREDGSLRAVLAQFEEEGQQPRVVRLRSGSRPEIPELHVDLQALSPGQMRALEAARGIGYFEPGAGVGVDDLARVLGCSRSTAHEHLQKAMKRLLDAILEAAGPQGTAAARQTRASA